MNSMGPMNFFSYDRHDRYDRYNDMETRLKCARDYQIENLAETNFVEIFGRAKLILSVQCVRTFMQVACVQSDMGQNIEHLTLKVNPTLSRILYEIIRNEVLSGCNNL